MNPQPADLDADGALMALIRAQIEAAGPMTLDRYMALCLGHRDHGYYMHRNPFGAAGDFTTAPEISQLFGEVLGAWVADFRNRFKGGAPFHLIELGPGRGTLMADMIRVQSAIFNSLTDLRVDLIEMSPLLTQIQQQTLADFDVPLNWQPGLEAIEPQGPGVIVANEFFDALPIRQFERSKTGWHERLVDTDGDKLTFVLSAGPVDAALIPEAVRGAQPGEIFELRPAAGEMIGKIARLIKVHGGAAVIVDYGFSGPMSGESLQAVKDHAFHDPLAAPGLADLTAHVDFAYLAARAREYGLVVLGPCPQSDFLRGLGIEMRADKLLQTADSGQRRLIETALKRLISPQEMGDLFKVMILTTKLHAPLAPFS